MRDLISVIIPVYNSEKYLEKCLLSLINQSYKKIELIIINDGSTDNSIKICNKFKKKDSRIVLINQENKGRSEVRNVGIKKAKGTYIMFVDSDDYVTQDFCLDALNEIKHTNSDIVFFDYFSVSNSVIQKRDTLYKNFNHTLTKEEAMTSIINSSFLPMKIIKKEIFNNIKFPHNKDYEDVFVTYKLVEKAKKISYLAKANYFYVQHSNSITHIKNAKSTSDYFEANLVRYSFFNNKYPLAAKGALDNLLIASFFYLVYNPKGKFSSKAKSIITSSKLSKLESRKLLYCFILYRWFPKLITKIVRFYFK